MTKNPANDQTVGAAIARDWYSTPQRLENVRAAVASLPNGSDALKALDNVMTVLRQTGMRQTTGSPTASNAANVGAFGPSSVTNAAIHPLKGVGENLENAFTKRSATNLAKILTDPNSAKLLKRIADFDPVQPYTSAGMATILNATLGNADKSNP